MWGKETHLHCCWECKLIQPLWRIVWRFPKKPQTELPNKPAIPLLSTHPEKTIIPKDTCTTAFIAWLFTIVRTWKKPKCPLTDEWIKKIWHPYPVKNYSAMKEQNGAICRDVDGPRNCFTEWSKSKREKQISYINTYMWNLEKWYRWTYLQSRNRDTDVENKHMDATGSRGSELGDCDWHIYAMMYNTDN